MMFFLDVDVFKRKLKPNIVNVDVLKSRIVVLITEIFDRKKNSIALKIKLFIFRKRKKSSEVFV